MDLAHASIAELATELMKRVDIGIIGLSFRNEMTGATSAALFTDAKGTVFEVNGLSHMLHAHMARRTEAMVLGRLGHKPEDDQDSEQWKRRGN